MWPVRESLSRLQESAADGRIVGVLQESAQETEKLVGCQAGLTNDPSESSDRKVFSLWDDHEPRLIASENQSSVTPFSATGCVHKPCVPQRGDDLSRREGR